MYAFQPSKPTGRASAPSLYMNAALNVTPETMTSLALTRHSCPRVMVAISLLPYGFFDSDSRAAILPSKCLQ